MFNAFTLTFTFTCHVKGENRIPEALTVNRLTRVSKHLSKRHFHCMLIYLCLSAESLAHNSPDKPKVLAKTISLKIVLRSILMSLRSLKYLQCVEAYDLYSVSNPHKAWLDTDIPVKIYVCKRLSLNGCHANFISRRTRGLRLRNGQWIWLVSLYSSSSSAIHAIILLSPPC